jgi:hypothetical protein
MARIRASGDVGVRVHGLTELNKTLREMGPEFQKELTQTNKSVAGFVADDAKAAAYSLGGVAAKVAPTVKAAGGTTWAGVSFGGSAYPFAGGAEFGSLRYKQFRPWRGNGSDAGYFLYPSIRRDADRITTEYTEALDRLLDRNGLA